MKKKLRLIIWFTLIGALATTVMGLSSLQTEEKRDLLSTGFFDVSTDGQNVFLISFDAKRNVLLPKYYSLKREYDYNDFDIINIGRNQTINEYFDKNFDTSLTFLAQDLPSKIDGDILKAGRQAIVGKQEKGFLTFGPWIELGASKYNLKITYKSNAPHDTQIGFLNISKNKGTTILEKMSLTGTNDQLKTLDIPFILEDNTKGVEFMTFLMVHMTF